MFIIENILIIIKNIFLAVICSHNKSRRSEYSMV